MKSWTRERRGALTSHHGQMGSFVAQAVLTHRARSRTRVRVPGALGAMLIVLVATSATATSTAQFATAGPRYGGTLHVAFALQALTTMWMASSSSGASGLSAPRFGRPTP